MVYGDIQDVPDSGGSGGGTMPSGIPDPNNPGYDTTGYPLQQQQPPPARLPLPRTPDATQPPASGSPTDWGALSQSIFGPMPGVTKPPAFDYAQFAPPSWEDVLKSDQGITFGINQGEQAVQQSAAAKGTLNTGGTLKDILDYGRNAATQGYGNAFNRALNSYVTNFGGALTKYNTNYNTQYLNPYSQMWGQYQQGVGNQQSLFNQQFQTATG